MHEGAVEHHPTAQGDGDSGEQLQREVVDRIAQVCHETNRAYCATIDDFSQTPWAIAPAWQKDSARAGVRQLLTDPTTTPRQSHEGWLRAKDADGWVYGPVKDAELKTHPCCVPYDELPSAQRMKDVLFGAVVRALISL